MSKDFDGERRERHAARERGLGARDFVLSGKRFTWLPNVSYTALESLSAADEFDGAELIRAIEGAMTEMIVEDQREQFLAVLRDKDDPYTFADLNAVATWLVEEQVKRPTHCSHPLRMGASPSQPKLHRRTSPPHHWPRFRRPEPERVPEHDLRLPRRWT